MPPKRLIRCAPKLEVPLKVVQAELAGRLWPQVKKTESCWLWTGYTRNGYGTFSFRDQHIYVHRVAYITQYGSDPGDLCVCHRCDNRLCVRKEHLFLGTRADNLADMRQKRRDRKPPVHSGERHHKAKLTDIEVIELRALYEGGGYTQRDLAKRFGVSPSSVSLIVRGRTRNQ